MLDARVDLLAFPHSAVLLGITQTQNQNKPVDNRPPTIKQAPLATLNKLLANHALEKFGRQSGQNGAHKKHSPKTDHST